MKLPLQITYRHVPPSEWLDALIREQVVALDTYYNAITRCHVLVEQQQRHHRDGNRFLIRVDLTVPGDEIVITHDPSLYQSLRAGGEEEVSKAAELEAEHTHVAVAVRDAFDKVRRRLEDYARRQRGDVKTHEAPLGKRHDR